MISIKHALACAIRFQFVVNFANGFWPHLVTICELFGKGQIK